MEHVIGPDFGETRLDALVARARASAGDVLLFAHRDILRVLAARWLGLSAHAGRHFCLATASLSILGHHHDLDERVIHLWNDARHPGWPDVEDGAHSSACHAPGLRGH